MVEIDITSQEAFDAILEGRKTYEVLPPRTPVDVHDGIVMFLKTDGVRKPAKIFGVVTYVEERYLVGVDGPVRIVSFKSFTSRTMPAVRP